MAHQTSMGKLSEIFLLDRYRSRAREHASERSYSYGPDCASSDPKVVSILPLHHDPPSTNDEAGGLNEKKALGSVSAALVKS